MQVIEVSPRCSTDGQTGPQAFERRVSWLEEDVAVLHRRLRDECNEGTAAGDSSLRALVARLDSELSAEKMSREAMEARMTHLEDSIRHERKEREAQLRGFSSELETTMRGLISRIDEGLSAGAAAMRERTDATESRLRSLIKRVDEGLSAGAAALQDTLTATDGLSASDLESLRSRMQPKTGGSREDVHVLMSQAVAEHLRYPRDQLRQDQLRNEQQRRQNGYSNSLATSPKSGTPSATPTSSMPQTMQVRGSGLSNAQFSGGTGVAGAGRGLGGAFQLRQGNSLSAETTLLNKR